MPEKNYIVKTVEPVLDTSIYAAGDSLCALVTITNAARRAGGVCVIRDLTVLDKSDQAPVFDIVIFDRDPTLPAANAAWDVSDANMEFELGHIPVAAADFEDLGGNRVAHPNIATPIWCKCVTGSRDLKIGLWLKSGTPTFAADSLQLRFGIEQN